MAANRISSSRATWGAVGDGRFKFIRSFSPLQHTTPVSMEDRFWSDDVEPYDLLDDPHELKNPEVESPLNAELLITTLKVFSRVTADVIVRSKGVNVSILMA